MEQVLPISNFKDQIKLSVLENRVVIISAETGAGKSTQVPQYLLELEYQVVCTQPRRMAAVALATRVAEEMEVVLGTKVGYRTGYEQKYSEDSLCLFVTDGLELVRELQASRKPDVLIIDEVHEWNLNIETLVAWAKRELERDQKFKVVIMSATMESQQLLEFFGQGEIINVPGRLFPVEEQVMRAAKISYQIAELARQGHNVLCFQPGKSEIAETIRELNEMNVSAQIMPLHGELTAQEQQAVFRHYGLPKVVISTNIAQTSITIDDIDRVVDSGLERRIETMDGIETLAIRRTSEADSIQRKGRAGRCKPGVYINAYTGSDEQLPFPVPEIKRVRLDQLCLRLLINGFDARTLEFFHQPKHADITEAMRTLHHLGAIDSQEHVTQLGKDISRLPISVHLAAMIIAAKRLNVLDDVLTIAACMEINGIMDRTAELSDLSTERTSDLLATLEVFNKALLMDKAALKENGIHIKSFFRAKELRQKLADSLIDEARRHRQWIEFKSSGNKRDILKACLTGMLDHIYIREHGGVRGLDDDLRSINKKSVVQFGTGSIIVGLPWNLEVPNRYGGVRQLDLLTMCTAVNPEILHEIAPDQIRIEKSALQVNNALGRLSICQSVYLGEKLLASQIVPVEWDQLEQYLPPGQTREQFREEFLRDRFDYETTSGFLQPMRYFDPNHFSLRYATEREFATDPIDGSSVMAYPGKLTINGVTLVRYFRTEQEAEELSKQSEPEPPVRVAKGVTRTSREVPKDEPRYSPFAGLAEKLKANQK